MPDLSHRCTSPAHIVVAALGLGLLLGLMWSSRNVNSDVEEWQVFVTRFASMAVFLVVAVVSRRDPQNETLC